VRFADKYYNANSTNYKTIGNCFIHENFCEELGFDYSVVIDSTDSVSFFFGQFDTYELKFSDEASKGTIIEYRNNGLTEILNHFIHYNDTSLQHPKFYYLKTFIGNLYTTQFESFPGARTSVFSRSISFSELEKSYKNSKNEMDFERLFFLKENTFIFEIPYAGAIVFQYSFGENGQVLIKEYLLPLKDRAHFARLGISTKEVEGCPGR
jgi:hypothetical protein